MRLIFLISLLILFEITDGQSSYTPTIVTLDPHIKTYDSVSAKEIYDLNKKIIQRVSHVVTGFGTNATKELILDSLFKIFQERMGFFSMLTVSISSNNNLALFGKSENIFSYPIHITSDGKIEDLEKIALTHNAAWVINPKKIEIETLNDVKTIKVQVQIYSLRLHKILLDKLFTASSNKLNPYLNCQENSLECCIDHISSEASPLILLIIGDNYKFW
jgi:hypothetical protein